MKIIGIEDYSRLIKDRLENPEAYSGRTLILWNASFPPDGIAYQVIENCCIEYNRTHSESQIWFRLSDFSFSVVDFSKQAFCDRDDMFGYKPCRLIFDTGRFHTKELNDWFHFVKTHANSRSHIPADCSLIACAQAESYNFNEGQLSNNCDIYSLQPSITEWAQWASPYFGKCKAFQPVVSFITKRGNVTNYHDMYGNPFTQTDFLYIQRIITHLEKITRNEKLHSIKEISKHDFDEEVGGVAIGFPIDEFWDFIQDGEW